MIRIVKKQRVPTVFGQIKSRREDYDDLVSEEKDAMKQVLLEEQGYKCAYCMSNISMSNSTIEHYIPRKGTNGDMSLSLDYRNLFAVCDTTRGCPEEEQTCEVKKGDKLLPVFEDTIRWLDIYFGSDIPDLTPELCLQSTLFRKAVWDILLTIPYGETMTYGEIAKILAQNIGKEKMSAQAVGGAVGHNPVSIIVPCHRAVGADGSLTGYAGGIDRKKFLLELEGNITR